MNSWLIPIFAIFNFFRGRGYPSNRLLDVGTSKGLTSLYSGIATYIATDDWIIGVIVWAGLWAWAVLGWGSYFSALHGRYKTKSGTWEREVSWIDSVTAKIVGEPDHAPGQGKFASRNLTFGTVAFAFRGLHIVPLFLALAIHTSNYEAIAYGIICGILQGAAYRGVRYIDFKRATQGDNEKLQIRAAELIFGAIIGAFVWLSV